MSTDNMICPLCTGRHQPNECNSYHVLRLEQEGINTVKERRAGRLNHLLEWRAKQEQRPLS